MEIFEVNACLWGGKFNPIIPRLRQVPNWWDRHNQRLETASRIVNGYLDFFEPDFVVEAEPGLADGLGFHQDRILPLAGLLTRSGDRNKSGHGLSVLSLYSDIYRTEFQFAHRHEHNVVDVVPENRPFSAFAACVFGAFPQETDLKYLGEAFTEAFAPKKVALNGESLAGLYQSGFRSALRLGHSKIDIDYHDHGDPAFFVLDAREPRDLIDFWNLRAIKRDIIPVPVQWLGALDGFCKEFIVKNHRPLPGNMGGVMIRTTVMFARSIPTNEIERLHANHFYVDMAGANVRQDWYPAIWRPSARFSFRMLRPTLSAAEKTFDTPFNAEKPEVRFDCLHPEFADKYGNPDRWANVVRFEDWTYKNQVATAFPCAYKNPGFPRFSIGDRGVLPTTEGFVIFPQYKNVTERWEMFEGTTAISNWLKTHSIKAVLSDAGRATQQIIQTMGGFWGVAAFAHADIVKILNQISRRPMSRSIHHQEFKNRIQTVTKDDIWRTRSFETLVERNVVELGFELKCTKCANWSWYALKQLDYQMVCTLCLRPFGFPIIEPGGSQNSKWAYRLIGPFALPDYARGGYAASLSIRFFSEVIGRHETEVTWSAGQELELTGGDKVEADFILWYQRKELFGNDHPTEVVFGEAKSFGGESLEEKRVAKDAFQADDVERMKRLAIRFPGSILVFSTMKAADQLSRDEIDRLAKLAKWGREYVGERRQTRAPVIVLTGTELFAPYTLRDAWEKAGGRHAQLIQQASVHFEKLSELADLTQQLYLNLPPYAVWLEAKWKNRAARRRNRSTPTATMPGDIGTGDGG